MDIELLKTFLEVKNTRHFGKASENLYLTQAAVSARVKQLEDHLGVRLFIRTRNNIQLTAEGERLVPHAETVLIAWSRARQEVALKLEQKHQLNIGTTAGLWHFLLQDKLSIIRHRMPELSLRAEAYTSEDLSRLLFDRMLDIVLLFDTPNSPDITYKPIGKLRLVLASTSPDITAKTALQENYVYVDWGRAFEIFHAKRFHDAPPAVLHTNMASIAETFILEHQGTAYLPESIVEDNQGKKREKTLHQIDGAPTFSRAVYVAYRSNSDRAELISELMPLLTI